MNPQWLKPPMSRTIFYGPKDVRAIEVRLYLVQHCFLPEALVWVMICLQIIQNLLIDPEGLESINYVNYKMMNYRTKLQL